MCGINGIFMRKPAQELEALVAGMNKAMRHRGPDAEGVWTEEGIALGHRRLSIIDLSDSGNQPMISADGKHVLVFNGEIYNFKKLKEAFAGHSFRSDTDTEVLLLGLMKEGKDFLDKLEGMFAFAWWDVDARRLLIARDRLGIKPVYYYHERDTFVFASEIRSLLSTNLFEAKICPNGLGEYLNKQTVHFPNTILEGVKMLPPGHYMEITAGGRKVHSWWKPSPQPIENSPPKVVVRDLLYRAVEKRLVADVPFGAFLSGGIDSSVIVALMAEISAGPVNTFNVSFDESEFSEAKFAKAIAKKFGTVHTEIQIKPDEFVHDIPKAIAAMDHPSGDGPNTWVVSGAVKKAGISMALSGLGGDELFAGYPIFARMLHLKQWYYKLGLRMASHPPAVWAMPAALREKLEALPKGMGLETAFYGVSRQVFSVKQIGQLLSSKPNLHQRIYELLKAINWPKDGYINTLSRLELTDYMHDVLLRDTDQMSMAHALEVRVPFLDHDLVNFVLSLSDAQKWQGRAKSLLIDAFADRLPEEVWNRKKMGFAFPWAIWLRTSLRPYVEAGLEVIKAMPEFEAAAVETLYRDFLAQKPAASWAKVWLLVVFGHWMKENVIK
jgi:asparagine synthase (glutamine-hydrolysing)